MCDSSEATYCLSASNSDCSFFTSISNRCTSNRSLWISVELAAGAPGAGLPLGRTAGRGEAYAGAEGAGRWLAVGGIGRAGCAGAPSAGMAKIPESAAGRGSALADGSCLCGMAGLGWSKFFTRAINSCG